MKFLDSSITSVNAAALLLGAAGLLSRLLGVLRDRMLASEFGAGRELDIYYAAFQIPDFMAVLFLLGAASAAILPVFQEYLARDRALAERLIASLARVFVVGAGLAAFVAALAAPVLISFIAPGFSEAEREMTVTLTRIMLLSPILFGLSGIFSTVVQSFGRFFAYALAPILYNVGIIIGIGALAPRFGLPGLAAGVVLGAFLHFGISWWTARELGFHVPILDRYRMYRSKIGTEGTEGEGIRRVFWIAIPRVLSVSLSNLTLLALVAIASTLSAGSIAVFQLAQNLYFVPIGIFAIGYATVLFPRMSRAFVARNGDAFFEDLFSGIRSILFWILPSAVLFIVLRAHIVRAALGAGAFSWEDTRFTAAVLAVFAVAMAAGALAPFFIKGFYALENTWRPLAINVVASVATIALALVFVQFFTTASVWREWMLGLFRIRDLLQPEVMGLAWGFALGLLLNAFLLYRSLCARAQKIFHMASHFPYAAAAKIFVASLIAGATAYGVRVSFAQTLPLIGFREVMLQGVLAGIAGVFVYMVFLLLLRSEEASALIATLRRHAFRVGMLPKSWEEV